MEKAAIQPQFIKTYTINESGVKFKEEIILSPFIIGVSFIKEVTFGRGRNAVSYYELRNGKNKTVLITDQNGYNTISGGDIDGGAVKPPMF